LGKAGGAAAAGVVVVGVGGAGSGCTGTTSGCAGATSAAGVVGAPDAGSMATAGSPPASVGWARAAATPAANDHATQHETVSHLTRMAAYIRETDHGAQPQLLT
jgi:hypothetical protein